MTVLTRRCIRIVLRKQGAVRTAVVLGDLFGMADAAIDLGLYRLAGALFGYCHLCVTLRARSTRVHRLAVVLFIDKQADRFAAGACHRQIGLRVAAQAVLVGQSVRVENVADLVWCMAVDTGRNLARIFGPQFAIDHLSVHNFDLRMTGRAHRGHIICVDARPRIGVRTNVVGRVTGSTDGSHGEALAEQAFAMNTHRVMLEDVLLRYLVSSGYGGSLSVATATEQRHVHHRRRRSLVRCRQDIVLAVTVGTDRRHRITAFCGYTMQTTFVRIGLWPVAAAAIDRLQVLGVPPALAAGQVFVTIHAGHVGMHGTGAGVRGNVDRNLLISAVTRQLRVVMTLEASAVLLCQRRRSRKPEDCGRRDEPKGSTTISLTTTWVESVVARNTREESDLCHLSVFPCCQRT